MKITLIIVDFQHDFAHPTGALYVPGAEKAKEGIIDFINQHSNKIEQIWFTQDWHPSNHCSFKENGGVWPVHCVQATFGADVDIDIINLCQQLSINYDFMYKGAYVDTEEYGVFDNPENRILPSDDRNLYVICGLAGDYCVMETYKGLTKFYPEFNVVLFEKGIASISDSQFQKLKEENKVLTI